MEMEPPLIIFEDRLINRENQKYLPELYRCAQYWLVEYYYIHNVATISVSILIYPQHNTEWLRRTISF